MCDSLGIENPESVYGGKINNSLIAYIHAALGGKPEMYEYLNKALLEEDASLQNRLYMIPELIDCQDDAEFQRIKREIWTPREL